MAEKKGSKMRIEYGDKPGAAEAAFSPPAAEAAQQTQPREIVEYKRQWKERINLAELDGSTIVITGYELLRSARLGAQMAVIRFFTPPEGREQEAYTFSKVVIRQLTEEIDPLLRSGKAVKVRIAKNNKYISLAPP
ncbi:MAG TPA: hypothetical protein VNK96_04060 [Fimbriimonadales bacterium]|nr:hypothetical protein [Fimbriimonadales bacterium]